MPCAAAAAIFRRREEEEEGQNMAAGPGGGPGPPDAPPQPPAAPRLWLQRGRVLVWGAAAARALRERYRVSGVLVGNPPRRGRPGAPPLRRRLPLQLLPEEARLLAESGAALLLTPPEPGSAALAAAEDGADVGQNRDPPTPNSCPTGPPERFHAAAVALVPAPGAGLPLRALVAAARLGTHVRKTLLLCSAPSGRSPAYTSVTWRGDL